MNTMTSKLLIEYGYTKLSNLIYHCQIKDVEYTMDSTVTRRATILLLTLFNAGGGAIIILFRKFAIAQEPNVRLTSNQAVNSCLYVV